MEAPAPRKKKNVPVRKRLKHKKRHVVKVNKVPEVSGEVSPAGQSVSILDNCEDSIDISDLQSPIFSPTSSEGSSVYQTTHECTDTSDVGSSIFSPTPSEGSSLCPTPQDFNELSETVMSPLSSEGTSLCSTPLPPPQKAPVEYDPGVRTLLMEVSSKLGFMLPQFFVPIIDNNGVHVIMVGRRESKAVQREVFVSVSGEVRVEVHGKAYPLKVPPGKPLNSETLSYFVDRIVAIVSSLRLLEICAGSDKAEYKEAWAVTKNGEIETDTFKECRYRETFRSNKCVLLVESGTWRCKHCKNIQGVLSRKLDSMKCELPPLKTNNRFMTEKQKERKLKQQQKKIKLKDKTINRLTDRITELVNKEGVKISSELADDLQGILLTSNLSIKQSMFLQQQMKAANCKKKCGMKWHPVMIRLALSIYLKSPAAYQVLQESGFVNLPTSRTLFDYSHASKIQPGIDVPVIESLTKRVAAEELKHPQFHVLMADEIHLSKNLVIEKSTGEIIGFKDLDKIDEEVALLDAYLDDSDKKLEPEMATKMLSFLVKGCSSKVKDVVASFPVCNPSPKQMYVWTWEVIGALERNAIKVIAFTCDGAPTNRAFIKLHKPATVLPSGIIFDTVNKFAPERLLYFFSDVPHLLKTIRNAFFNSRLSKKGVRCLKKHGEPIVWDTIIRLYLLKKSKTLRKSYKLNPQNVFPDSFTRMKVAPAAQVISRTVGNDICSQGWPRTSETVDFIFRTNDWFDLLNGAYIGQGTRTQNPRLNAYTIKDVEEFEEGIAGNRFQQILDYVQYHKEWVEEIKNKINSSTATIYEDLGVAPLDEISFHALLEEDVADPLANPQNPNQENAHDGEDDVSMKCLLPHQTLTGIEMSSRAFIGAVTFLMKAGVPFVNARAFCQDPLEQNFGKQRMAGGGSCNPNASRYLNRQRCIHLIGQLGTSAQKMQGNTEVLQEDANLSSEPLPKRRKLNRNC